ERDLIAEPAEAWDIGHAQFLEPARNGNRLPGGIVDRWIGPGTVLRADVVVVVPVHDVVAVLLAALLALAFEERDARVEVLQWAQGVYAGEGLGRNAAHCLLEQADGHMYGLPHLPG